MHFFSLNVNIEFISLFLPYYACFLCKFFSLTLHICRFLSSGKVNIFSIVFSSIFYSINILHQYQHDNPNYHKKGKCYVDQTSQN